MLRIVLTLLLFQHITGFNFKKNINLRNIVISSALMTTITKRINNELINETISETDSYNKLVKKYNKQKKIKKSTNIKEIDESSESEISEEESDKYSYQE